MEDFDYGQNLTGTRAPPGAKCHQIFVFMKDAVFDESLGIEIVGVFEILVRHVDCVQADGYKLSLAQRMVKNLRRFSYRMKQGAVNAGGVTQRLPTCRKQVGTVRQVGRLEVNLLQLFEALLLDARKTGQVDKQVRQPC